MPAAELTESELLEVLSPSLFGDDRVAIITAAENIGKIPADLLLKAAKDPGPGIYLIIEHTGTGRSKAIIPKLKNLSSTHDATAPRRNELPAWVRQQFISQGRKVAPDVIQSLIEGVGSDLRELASAVSQLSADAGAEITTATVRSYYSGVAEVSTFDIADWAVSGKKSKALAATRRALQLGISPVAIAAALASKIALIARLYGIRGRADTKVLAGTLGAHPFVVEKTIPIARKWSSTAVSQAVILMADLDAALKGQGGQPEYEIEAAVRTIARLAS
ncbi:hypothetical protein CCASP_02260 [Corynebacterium caspium DSM 44850]|nr:hypothetical protein CCASP_02260 [Corynebacterium caspium DSM 44850]